MARTMKWPPVPVNGRLPFVEGAEATRILVMSTLSDLSAMPFNDDDLSLADQTFRAKGASKGRIESTLKRLQSAIRVQGITEIDRDDGDGKTYIVDYVDLETRQKGKVTING